MPSAMTEGFRILYIVDDFSREALATVSNISPSGARMTRELDKVIQRRDKPEMIVCDNGTEMTSHAVLKQYLDKGINWHY